MLSGMLGFVTRTACRPEGRTHKKAEKESKWGILKGTKLKAQRGALKQALFWSVTSLLFPETVANGGQDIYRKQKARELKPKGASDCVWLSVGIFGQTRSRVDFTDCWEFAFFQMSEMTPGLSLDSTPNSRGLCELCWLQPLCCTCMMSPGAMDVRSSCSVNFRFSSIWSVRHTQKHLKLDF